MSAYLEAEYHSKIKAVVKGENDKESYVDKFVASMIHIDNGDFGDKIEHESYKEHLEVFVDDDDKEEKKDDEMVHGKVDQVLHERVPQLAETAINDLIKGNLKRVMAETVIQERDAFKAEVLALISKEFDVQAPHIIEELSRSMDDEFHSQRHNDHQEDVAPLEGKKRVKRHKTSKSSKSARGSSSK
nr:hypothetical protein [Tanacetum cinerariifolium]